MKLPSIPSLVSLKYAGLAIVAAAALGFLIGHIKGNAVASIECAEQKTDVIKEEVTKNEKDKRKVMALPDLALCREYCQRVRDDKKLCLARCDRGDLPIRE